MKPFSRTLCLALVVVALMGCNRTQPIYNVDSRPVPQMAQKKVSPENVGKLITQTALELGWLVEKVKPGLLHCSLKWREHIAVVDITYTATTYSIQHVSSENLIEQAGQVHRKYNDRIHQLQDEVDRALSKAANG